MSQTMRWVALAAVLAWACAENPDEGRSPGPVHDESGAPVVATLRTKDSELTITGRGGNVRYSLLDAAGQRRENLTLEELHEYDQNLYEVVKFAMAKNVGREGAPVLDARVDPTPIDSVVKSLTAGPAPRAK
jgi:hypothetical protein